MLARLLCCTAAVLWLLLTRHCSAALLHALRVLLWACRMWSRAAGLQPTSSRPIRSSWYVDRATTPAWPSRPDPAATRAPPTQEQKYRRQQGLDDMPPWDPACEQHLAATNARAICGVCFAAVK